MKAIVFLISLTAILLTGNCAAAQESGGLVVNPQIIDEKTKARDILDYSIRVVNQSGRYAQFYVFVNDLDPETGRQEFKDPASLDKTKSLASWISISRGVVELMPGEEVEIPLNIKVNFNAKPGKRHAVITFAQGSNRPDAERNLLGGGQPQLYLNLEVAEDIIERAQVIEFKSEQNVYFEPPYKFSLTIKNIGNYPVAPRGFVYFYNRRGEEVDKIAIAEEGVTISPDSVLRYSVAWDNSQTKGKYRARFEAEYGQQLRRDLQDTIYFWVFPKNFVIMTGAGLFCLVFIMSVFVYKMMYHRPAARRHIERQAATGVINLKDEE